MSTRNYRRTQVAKMAERGWHTPTSIADRMSLNPTTVYRWYYDEKVLGMKVGRAIYLSEDSLCEYLGKESYAELDL